MTQGSLLALAGAAMLHAGAAMGTTYQWNWNLGDPGAYGVNHAGGQFESIHSTFDTTTKQLVWNVVFSNQVTDGYTLVLSGGPNPKGHAGELAVLYFDFRNAGDMRLTAYAYNGTNSSKSWQDGNGQISGNQTPDSIKTITDGAWITSASKVDAGGKRMVNLTIDATDLINHSPMYPDNVDPWFGTGYGAGLGLWFHTFKGLTASYDGAGKLTQWSRSQEGWFDGRDFQTQIIPLPGAAGLAFAGLLVAGGRRRR